ncbi:hypothetical protein BOX15_Mlig018542g1 [Macrostomum lignano]|uniref:Fibronectin type-III domain-containing protein n=1 Tax=Macrostomum lignano TaxID=282301 RepID=A0A267GZE5_9PLAT|nr:hypothetical protein BOX15_Mlig018542g1 [Macrostomum lignano]
MADMPFKWKKVAHTSSGNIPLPRPRHGHKAVSIKDLIIIFGGGNEGIIDDLHVFNTTTGQWFQPQVRGDVPHGCAAFGFVADGTRILLFGGMMEYGRYSDEVFELQATRWEWKRIKPKPPRHGPPPCARLGHSFTLAGGRAILFGGLANKSTDLKANVPHYLDDLYAMDVKAGSTAWDLLKPAGMTPCPRESHSAVSFQTAGVNNQRKWHLLVFGGMNNGTRLNDLWQLDLDSLVWTRPMVHGSPPAPRSLHSATMIGAKMFVFGGWAAMTERDKTEALSVGDTVQAESEWRCTNTLACLDLETLNWHVYDYPSSAAADDLVPRPRAGHCAVSVNSRLWIWSGRDGFRKAWGNQVCFKDLWLLETDAPPVVGRVQLVKANTHSLDVCWPAVATADEYVLQIQKYDLVVPAPTPPPTPTSAIQPGVAALMAAGVPVSASMAAGGGGGGVARVTLQPQRVAPTVVVSRPAQVIQLARPAGQLAQQQMMTLVKTPTGQQILRPTMSSASQVVKLLPQQARPLAPGATGTSKYIIAASRGSIGQPQAQGGATASPIIVMNAPASGQQQQAPSFTVKPVISTGGTGASASTSDAGGSSTIPQFDGAVDEGDEAAGADKPDGHQAAASSSSTSGATPTTSGAAAATASGGSEDLPTDLPYDLFATVADSANGTPGLLADPLATLASVAAAGLKKATPAATVSTSSSANPLVASGVSPASSSNADGSGGLWHDVATVRGTSYCVRNYLAPNSAGVLERCDLTPGTAYRFRVCAVNACGRGPWSEVAAYKTCVPGFPGAPSAIKINKSDFGAQLSWEPPPPSAPGSGDIFEYTVYLAVKPAPVGASSIEAKTAGGQQQMSFARVYCGSQPFCQVSNQSLAAAYIDMSSKPAVIFRIAARNDKGYGPATQVRWLQEGASALPGVGIGGGGLATGSKRLAQDPMQQAKRVKDDY